VTRDGANLGDHGVLPIVADAHSGVVTGRAFGMDHESGPDAACCGGVGTLGPIGRRGQSDLGAFAVGSDAEHRAVVEALRSLNTRIDARIKGGREIAVAHHVAEPAMP
jgi:hypothetical protein